MLEPVFTLESERLQTDSLGLCKYSASGLVKTARPLWKGLLGWVDQDHPLDPEVATIPLWSLRSAGSGYRHCSHTAHDLTYVALIVIGKWLSVLGEQEACFSKDMGILVSVQVTLTGSRSHPSKALCEELGMC